MPFFSLKLYALYGSDIDASLLQRNCNRERNMDVKGDCHIKVSTKVECGIIALIDIALYSENGKPVAVSSISSRQNISMKYLEQILVALRQANLIRSLKGFKGGYVMARPADQITFQEILDALDVTILGNVNFYDTDQDSILKNILNDCLWDQMTSYLRNFSNSITLSEIIEKYRGSLSDAEEPMYYI